MTPDSLWGPIVESVDIEDGIRLTLQRWLDSALNDIERRRAELGPREIPRPTRWEAVDDVTDVKDWPDRDLPTVLVETAGEQPRPSDGGGVDASMAFTLRLLYRGTQKHVDRELDRRYVIHLATAVRLVLFKVNDLDGLVDGITIGTTRYDFAAPLRPRTLSGFEMDLVVSVTEVLNRWGLPPAPDPPDEPPPTDSPTDPLHVTTTVAVSTTLPESP